mmetsp:Transcript_22844/g.49425  ORF Transcript_22844/g.49425 Transcript_22844/m.49425 type:complete len:157 (+) Transcript_22844:270-740(+)
MLLLLLSVMAVVVFAFDVGWDGLDDIAARMLLCRTHYVLIGAHHCFFCIGIVVVYAAAAADIAVTFAPTTAMIVATNTATGDTAVAVAVDMQLRSLPLPMVLVLPFSSQPPHFSSASPTHLAQGIMAVAIGMSSLCYRLSAVLFTIVVFMSIAPPD